MDENFNDNREEEEQSPLIVDRPPVPDDNNDNNNNITKDDEDTPIVFKPDVSDAIVVNKQELDKSSLKNGYENTFENEDIKRKITIEGDGAKRDDSKINETRVENKSYTYQIEVPKESKKPAIISLEEWKKYKNFFITVHPFIINGYRIHHSITDCLKSIFIMHNETMNIWSHLLPFLVFLVLFIYNLANDTFKHHVIVYLYIFTTFLFLLFSSIHHTFNCHSNEVWQCCYKMDLLGIMFQLVTSTMCTIQFMFHDFDDIRKIYGYSFLALGCCTIVLSMFDFFISAKLNLFLMFSYATLFLISFLSSIHWVAIANLDEVEAISAYVLMAYLFIYIGFSIFLAKFPECLVQNKFIDYYFNSHIIWHLTCVASAVCYYVMLHKYYLLVIDD